MINIASSPNSYRLVDLAIDSPPSAPPTVTLLGPTLVPMELAGRKMLALFGRAEARDFADAYVLAKRFGKGASSSRQSPRTPVSIVASSRR